MCIGVILKIASNLSYIVVCSLLFSQKVAIAISVIIIKPITFRSEIRDQLLMSRESSKVFDVDENLHLYTTT